MSCDTNFELLMAYLDGDLSPLERGRLAEHIVGCEDCRSTVNDLRAVSGALTKWTAPEPQRLPAATELLERAGFAPTIPVEPSPWREAVRRWGAVAALVAVAGLVGVYAIGNYSSKEPQFVAQTEEKAPRSAPAQPSPNGSAGGGLMNATNATSQPQPPAADKREPSSGPDATKEGEAAGSASNAPVDDARAPSPEPAVVQRPDDAVTSESAPPPPPVAEEARPAQNEDRSLAKSAPAPQPQAPSSSAVPGGSAGAAPARAEKKAKDEQTDAKYIKTGVLEIEVRDLAGATGDVESAARSAGGRAARGVEVQQGDVTRIAITVSIPADRFDAVFERLRGLGVVRNQMRSNKDVTASVDQIDRELDQRRDADDAASTRLERRRQGLIDSTRTGTIRVTLVRKD